MSCAILGRGARLLSPPPPPSLAGWIEGVLSAVVHGCRAVWAGAVSALWVSQPTSGCVSTTTFWSVKVLWP